MPPEQYTVLSPVVTGLNAQLRWSGRQGIEHRVDVSETGRRSQILIEQSHDAGKYRGRSRCTPDDRLVVVDCVSNPSGATAARAAETEFGQLRAENVAGEIRRRQERDVRSQANIPLSRNRDSLPRRFRETRDASGVVGCFVRRSCWRRRRWTRCRCHSAQTMRR